MLNLIRVELKKLAHLNAYWALLAFAAVISAISAYSLGTGAAGTAATLSGQGAAASVFMDVSMVFASAVLAGPMIGADFQNKSLRMNITYGHSRAAVLFSKAAVYFIAATALQSVYPILNILRATLTWGWGGPSALPAVMYLARTFLLWMLLNTATISFFVLAAFVCRDAGLTIGVSIGGLVLFMLVAPLLKSIPATKGLISLAPLAQMERIVQPSLNAGAVLSILACAAACTAFFLSVTYLLFRRMEIK